MLPVNCCFWCSTLYVLRSSGRLHWRHLYVLFITIKTVYVKKILEKNVKWRIKITGLNERSVNEITIWHQMNSNGIVKMDRGHVRGRKMKYDSRKQVLERLVSYYYNSYYIFFSLIRSNSLLVSHLPFPRCPVVSVLSMILLMASTSCSDVYIFRLIFSLFILLSTIFFGLFIILCLSFMCLMCISNILTYIFVFVLLNIKYCSIIIWFWYKT